MKKKHICLVGIEYPPDTAYGGIATYQKIMAQALKDLGHQVTVICGTDKEPRTTIEEGIRIIRLYTSRTDETLDTFNQYRVLVKKTILELDKKEKIDIIETPEFSGEIVEFLKQHSIPVVVKLHTSYRIWSSLNHQKMDSSLTKRISDVEDLTMNYADQVICCSERLKNLLPHYHPTVATNSIEVIPNPADTEHFFPTDANHQNKTIIYCGSLEKRKGILQLIKAIPLVLKKLQDKEIKFQLVGQVDEQIEESLRNKIPLKYRSQVEFLGHVDNRELNTLYNAAKIGVVPSLFDNLPYVAMEELLTELPLVASNNTGIIEMIEDKKSGLLYDPKDVKKLAEDIIYLYQNPGVARNYGKEGRKQIIKKFSPDIVAKKNLALYEKVIERFKQGQKKSLHVCLTNFEYPQETSLGGIATYQQRMARALFKEGCKVTVICGSFTTYQDYYEDGIHVYRLPKNFPYQNKRDYYDYRYRLAQKIAEINEFDKIDIIESPEISAELITFLKNRNIPVVTKLHTSYTIVKALNQVAMFPKEVEEIIFRNENHLLKESDKVICCSNFLKQLMPLYHPTTNLDQIEVVPNPADIDSFYPLPNCHQSKTILYCGNFTKRKGVFQFAKAIPLIIDSLKDKNLKFQIIGSYDGAEQKGISLKEEFLKDIPKEYQSQIEFLGHVPNKKLNPLYNAARIGVIPSLFDNLPYVAMEELLTELPLVASNNTGIIEMIENEKSGLFYDPNDYVALANTVVKLYRDKDLALKCGKNGRKAVIEKYAPQLIAQRMMQIYRQTIHEFNDKMILNEISKKYPLTKMHKTKEGGANIVRICHYKDQKSILKIYDPAKNYHFALMEQTLKNVPHVNKIITKDYYRDYSIYFYSYIKGKHHRNYTYKEIIKICHWIASLNYTSKDQVNETNSLFSKYETYRNYVNQNNKDIKKNILKTLAQYNKEQVTILKNEPLSLIHGDLSPTNIIWQKNEPWFIDFDECCYAPKEYEYISFLIKSCYHNSYFDIILAKRIIEVFHTQGIDFQKLKQNYYFYILKVIYEKLYYHVYVGLDLDSPSQRKDYWKDWYKLLQNEVIIDILFSSFTYDYKLIRTKYGKRDSKVYELREGNNKYLLKLVPKSSKKIVLQEQQILVNLVNYAPIAPLVNIREHKGSIEKRYPYLTYSKKKASNQEMIKAVKKLASRLHQITPYVSTPIGSVKEKLKSFTIKNPTISNIIAKLDKDQSFMEYLEKDFIAIVHDDLNKDNILETQKGIFFIDFEGLKKYPHTLQLASFIALYYLCENKDFSITEILAFWPEKVDIDYLDKLIVFRLIKVYNYYENEEKLTTEEQLRKDLVFKRIQEWSDKIWFKQGI